MTTARRLAEDSQPWYRQPWPWVLIGLPGVAVVASIASLFIALHGADDTVADNYYKQGLAINRELSADSRARELGLHAQLEFDAGAAVVDVAVSGAAALPPQLTARFLHPVAAAQDFTLPLLRRGDRYVGQLPRPLAGRWTVEILDDAAHWRLRREITLTPERRSFTFAP